MSLVTQMLSFVSVGQEKEAFKGANFLGKGFTYLPEDKRKDLYGYNPKKDAELGADDNVLGNVPFLVRIVPRSRLCLPLEALLCVATLASIEPIEIRKAPIARQMLLV